MNAWLVHHGQSAVLAWRRLAAAPVNSMLSLLAIGIALALPAGGQMLLVGARHLAAGTPTTPQITVFMNIAADRGATAEVRSRLEGNAAIAQARFVAREETLARMKSNPGLKEVIEALAGNPFPDAFVLTPRDETPAAMERVSAEIGKWPGVEHVQLDSAWARRLDALLRLGRTALLLLAALLGGGLVAITFSVIRMQVLTQRTEIEVSRLLGATESFIRRPFLYHGFLLGLGGGIIAWLIVWAAAIWLRTPVGDLAGLYELKFELSHLGGQDSALLLAGASALGWIGALFSLRQSLEK